jgi:hypothetical protein
MTYQEAIPTLSANPLALWFLVDTKKAVELRQAELSRRKLEAATGVPVHLLRTRLASVQNSRGEKK